jgi:N-carbamoyl-L-amino-acid hydrolase
MEFDIKSNILFIQKRINELEKITEQDQPYSRLVFSKEFYDGRSWLNKQYKSLGLSISTDEAGNLIGLLKTNRKTDKVVLIGSHIDTVPSGGRYDGIAGVVSALCVMNHVITSTRGHSINMRANKNYFISFSICL